MSVSVRVGDSGRTRYCKRRMNLLYHPRNDYVTLPTGLTQKVKETLCNAAREFPRNALWVFCTRQNYVVPP